MGAHGKVATLVIGSDTIAVDWDLGTLGEELIIDSLDALKSAEQSYSDGLAICLLSISNESGEVELLGSSVLVWMSEYGET